MACQHATENIDGDDFSVRQWNATKSMLVKMQLLEAFGPIIATLSSSEDGEIDISALTKAIGVSKKPIEMVNPIKDCIVLNVAHEDSLISNEKFDEYFTDDKLITVYKVFIFVLKVNYSKIFNGQLMKGQLARLKGDLSKL